MQASTVGQCKHVQGNTPAVHVTCACKTQQLIAANLCTCATSAVPVPCCCYCCCCCCCCSLLCLHSAAPALCCCCPQVLSVDDDQVNQLVASTALRLHKWEVVKCMSGAEVGAGPLDCSQLCVVVCRDHAAVWTC
jgi:hypothetical protein